MAQPSTCERQATKILGVETMHIAFFVLGGFLLFVSAIRTYSVQRAIVETLPPQFQEYEKARYAVSVYALEPTTPLDVQADYVRSEGLACGACLSISAGLFAADHAVFGSLALIAFAWTGYGALADWKTYMSNRERAQRASEDI